jgi:hypothetical protein
MNLIHSAVNDITTWYRLAWNYVFVSPIIATCSGSRNILEPHQKEEFELEQIAPLLILEARNSSRGLVTGYPN